MDMKKYLISNTIPDTWTIDQSSVNYNSTYNITIDSVTGILTINCGYYINN